MRGVIRPMQLRASAPTIAIASVFVAAAGLIAANVVARGAANVDPRGTPYAAMPTVAPIGVRVDRYRDIPAFAKGPAIDAA